MYGRHYDQSINLSLFLTLTLSLTLTQTNPDIYIRIVPYIMNKSKMHNCRLQRLGWVFTFTAANVKQFRFQITSESAESSVDLHWLTWVTWRAWPPRPAGWWPCEGRWVPAEDRSLWGRRNDTDDWMMNSALWHTNQTIMIANMLWALTI